ncbi:MAG: hypothetical protein RL329_1819 [Bacteroidota bacterium]|jgi:hypothetical protein
MDTFKICLNDFDSVKKSIHSVKNQIFRTMDVLFRQILRLDAIGTC